MILKCEMKGRLVRKPYWRNNKISGMIWYNNLLWVEYGELVDAGVSGNTIRYGCSKGLNGWEISRHPDDARKALIRYDTLKPKYRLKIGEHYGDEPTKVAARQQLERLKEMKDWKFSKQDDWWYYCTYRDERDQYLFDHQKGGELAEAAAWLRLCTSVESKADAQALGYPNKKQLMDAVLKLLKEKPIEGLKVTSLRVLFRKMRKFKESGRESLVSGKYGNQNTRKIEGTVAAWLKRMYSDPRKLSFVEIHRQYEEYGKVRKWSKLSLSAIKYFLKQPWVQMDCLLQRHGKSEWHNRFDQNIRRSAALYPHAMWIMDGSKIELYYTSEKGNWNRLYGFPIVDASSWAIVGIAFGETETEDLVFRAIKDAANNTGYLPAQLQMDNSSAIKAKDMMEWYKTFAKIVSPTGVGNAKAKIVEPLFKHFNEQILKPNYRNYAGAGITAKRVDNHVNRDWLRKHKEVLPDREGCINQMMDAIRMWNDRPIRIADDEAQSPNERLTVKEGHPKAMKLSFEMRVSVFWKYRMNRSDERQTYEYTSDGITFQYKNRTYKYRVYASDGSSDEQFWRNNAGLRFDVKYDPDDFSMICLYRNDKQVAIAEELKLVPMAAVDHQEGDREFLNKELTKRKAMEKEVKKRFEEETELLESIGETLDYEGYVKVPTAEDGKYKDRVNAAEDVLKQLDKPVKKGVVKMKPMEAVGVVVKQEEEDDGIKESLYRRKGNMEVMGTWEDLMKRVNKN